MTDQRVNHAGPIDNCTWVRVRFVEEITCNNDDIHRWLLVYDVPRYSPYCVLDIDLTNIASLSVFPGAENKIDRAGVAKMNIGKMNQSDIVHIHSSFSSLKFAGVSI